MFEAVWQEFNKKDQVVTKRKVFKTYAALVRYLEKVEQKDNFWQVIAYSGV